jgi:hypothetical protein
MEPTGRANARPMTGSAKSGAAFSVARPIPDCASLHQGYANKMAGIAPGHFHLR